MLLKRILAVMLFFTLTTQTRCLRAFTVVNSPVHTKALAASAVKANVELDILVTRWSGFTSRWKTVIRALQNISENEPILVVDGYDVVIVGTATELNRKYEELTGKCAECLLFGITSNRMFPSCGSLDPLRLNAGVAMGRPAAFRRLASAMINVSSTSRGLSGSDDQVLLNSKLCSMSQYFVADKHEEFAASVEGTNATDALMALIGFSENPKHKPVWMSKANQWCVGQKCPLIVHGNGRADLSKLHAWLGIVPKARPLIDAQSIKQSYNAAMLWQLRGAPCCLGAILFMNASAALIAAGLMHTLIVAFKLNKYRSAGVIALVTIILYHFAAFAIPATFVMLAVFQTMCQGSKTYIYCECLQIN